MKIKPTTSQHQQGIAVLMVLVVLAIIAVSAARFLSQHQLTQASSYNLLRLGQLQAYLSSAEHWAIAQMTNFQQQMIQPDNDSSITFALPTMPNGSLYGSLIDLQGRFNLNNLHSPGQRYANSLAVFNNLASNLGFNEQFSSRVVAELATRKQQNISSTVLNDFVFSPLLLEELISTNTINVEQHALLQPYLSLIPRYVPINVNTASATILSSLDANIDSSIAHQLVQHRQRTPWQRNEDFLYTLGQLGIGLSAQQRQSIDASISTQSYYFLLTLYGNVEEFSMQRRIMIYSPPNASKTSSKVLLRLNNLH